MKKLQLGSTPVCTTTLTQGARRAAPCEVLLPVTPENQAPALAEFAQAGAFGNFRGLQISGIADIGFLRDFPNLLYLELIGDTKIDTAPLAELSNLRGLRIDTPARGIDFRWFPELEVFIGQWHAENRNLQHARELHKLRINGFKAKDLSDLAHIVRLELLDLVKTQIESLQGIETLEDLRFCEIAYAPKLASLDALGGGKLQLRELSLSNAKAIRTYAPIAECPWLRRLRLSACAPLPDVAWLQPLARLDSFSFVETNLESGDLSPLLELPALRYVGTMDKKHYNFKMAELNKRLGERHAGRT